MQQMMHAMMMVIYDMIIFTWKDTTEWAVQGCDLKPQATYNVPHGIVSTVVVFCYGTCTTALLVNIYMYSVCIP